MLFLLRECIWNAHAVSLVLPGFDDTGSLGLPPRWVDYPPIPPGVAASHFLAGNWEAELKPTTFSSFLLFGTFLSFLLLTPVI